MSNTKVLILRAVMVSAKLDDARKGEKVYQKELDELMPEIESRTGLTLWSMNPNGRYFWMKKDQGRSIEYENESAALGALLSDSIEWKP